MLGQRELLPFYFCSGSTGLVTFSFQTLCNLILYNTVDKKPEDLSVFKLSFVLECDEAGLSFGPMYVF